jgi:hypothetical protein
MYGDYNSVSWDEPDPPGCCTILLIFADNATKLSSRSTIDVHVTGKYGAGTLIRAHSKILVT